MSEEAVRASFSDQEHWAAALGSPFMSRLCGTFAARLDHETRIGRRLLDWPGNPDIIHDAVPLRIAGGLHALVRRGQLPDLARLYPPNPLPEPDALWEGVSAALVEAEDELLPWLDSAPQTNEVARSSVLMAGLLVLARDFPFPVTLWEMGASAGLNLMLDRYCDRLGGRPYGPTSSPLLLVPDWSGPPPPSGQVQVEARRGVDLNPIDLSTVQGRERLPAYVWPDQKERIARVETAIAMAAGGPPHLDRGDAAAWLDARLAEEPRPGSLRVVYHTIAFQYFPGGTQAWINAAMAAAGEAATPETPLARLSFESDGGRGAELKMRVWPGGEERLLARSDGHIRSITWLGRTSDD